MTHHIRSRQVLVFIGLLITVALLLPPTATHAAPVVPAPVQQESEPVFALPGVLEKAIGQPFDTYLTTADETKYGLVGKTPDVEQEITALRDLGGDTQVKVWGTLYPTGRLSSQPEIVVSDVQSEAIVVEDAPEETAPGTGTSVAIVRVDVANVRSGPGTIYPVVGQLQLNQVCPIIGRNADNSWWNVECGTGVGGWLSDTVVRTVADPARLPILVVPPPAVVQPPAVAIAAGSGLQRLESLLLHQPKPLRRAGCRAGRCRHQFQLGHRQSEPGHPVRQFLGAL